MNMQRKSILVIFLIFLIPSTVFAESKIRTGYDLYENIKLMDAAQSPDDFATVMFTMGYLKGCIDGLIFMQDVQYNNMFPPKLMTAKEREKFSKEMNFHRLKISKEGIATGQFILIYKNFAEKYPKELSGSARVCIFQSLIEAYGWK